MKKYTSLIYLTLTAALFIAYFLYYKIYTKNVPTETEIEAYIKNSEIIKLNNIRTSDFKVSSYTHFFALYSYPKSRISFLVKSEDSKYFIILDYDHKQSAVFSSLIQDMDINARVNKTEYRSRDYGTQHNPVPILYFNDAHNPDDIYIDEAHYRKNVKEYLTYDKQSSTLNP